MRGRPRTGNRELQALGRYRACQEHCRRARAFARHPHLG
jgi:hypothetical protein